MTDLNPGVVDLMYDLRRLLDEYGLVEATATVQVSGGHALAVRVSPSGIAFERDTGESIRSAP